MTRNDKIKLIQKYFTDQWIIESCLKVLKDYDKQKKAHRIEELTKTVGELKKDPALKWA